MGAQTFKTTSTGINARAAFQTAVEEARYENGHGGYTGTIAEKHSFIMIADSTLSLGAKIRASDRIAETYKPTLLALLENAPTAADIAQTLIALNDPRIVDKWGPAGCIDCGGGKFLFFGWASS